LFEFIDQILRLAVITTEKIFYHAFLAGIFARAEYAEESNREHGNGRSDIVVYETINARDAFLRKICKDS